MNIKSTKTCKVYSLLDSTTSPLLNSSYPHRGTYRCYLCKYECVSRQLLYGHYANQHFKASHIYFIKVV